MANENELKDTLLENEKSNNEVEQSKDLSAYRDVFPDKHPSQMLYYEKGRSHKIRSADVKELKDWSEMDKSQILDINSHLDSIMKACCRITLGTGSLGSYKDVSQFDKFALIFSIRDLTMQVQQREVKIYQSVTNPKDGNDVKQIEITGDSFNYYNIDKDFHEKYYDESLRCYVVKDVVDEKVDEKPLQIYIPTIGVVEAVQEYVEKQRELMKEGKGFIDEGFIKNLPFIIPNWRQVDKDGVFLRTMYDDYKKWSYDKHMSMVEIRDNLNYGIKPTIHVDFKTENGGTVGVDAPINFRSFKDIFNLSNKSRKLFANKE
jgi:hypothetical protein